MKMKMIESIIECVMVVIVPPPIAMAPFHNTHMTFICSFLKKHFTLSRCIHGGENDPHFNNFHLTSQVFF